MKQLVTNHLKWESSCQNEPNGYTNQQAPYRNDFDHTGGKEAHPSRSTTQTTVDHALNSCFHQVELKSYAPRRSTHHTQHMPKIRQFSPRLGNFHFNLDLIVADSPHDSRHRQLKHHSVRQRYEIIKDNAERAAGSHRKGQKAATVKGRGQLLKSTSEAANPSECTPGCSLELSRGNHEPLPSCCEQRSRLAVSRRTDELKMPSDTHVRVLNTAGMFRRSQKNESRKTRMNHREALSEREHTPIRPSLHLTMNAGAA